MVPSYDTLLHPQRTEDRQFLAKPVRRNRGSSVQSFQALPGKSTTADTTHMRDWPGGNSALEGKSAVSTAGGPATISGRHRTRKRRNAMTERPDAADPATGSVRYVDPEGLNKNPAFTNVVVVEGPVRTVHVGGQNAVDASGNIVGKGDIAAQTEQVLANVRAALAAGGAEPEHVIKWNLLLVEGVSLQEGFSAFQRAWVTTPNPPAITAAFVAGLANPEFLVEMDAIAVVPL